MERHAKTALISQWRRSDGGVLLADSLMDLKERLRRMVVAWSYDDQPITCGDIKAEGAMTALLCDALKPNLVKHWRGRRLSSMAARLQTSLTAATVL